MNRIHATPRTFALVGSAAVAALTLMGASPSPSAAHIVERTGASVTVQDPAGDERVYHPAETPKKTLDIRRVQYQKVGGASLRVTIKANDIIGNRKKPDDLGPGTTENFYVYLYPRGGQPQWTVRHKAGGPMEILRLNRKSTTYRKIPGKFVVRPSKNLAILSFPTKTFNSPSSVSVAAATYLEDTRAVVQTMDLSKKGRPLALR